MNGQFIGLKNWLPLTLTLCLVLVATSVLSACNAANEQEGNRNRDAVSQSGAPKDIGVPALEAASTVTAAAYNHPNGTEIALGKQVGATKVAQNEATIAAIVTLSPRVTPPHGPVYLESPVPTATWATGYFGGLDNVSPSRPEYISCWAGYYLGTKPMEVCAGHQQRLSGDPQQGMLLIAVWEPDQETAVSMDSYQTPEKVGVMHIVVADNNSVTIASEDGQHVFNFNIATHQWLALTPVPSPSISVSPIPSISPLPTQLP